MTSVDFSLPWPHAIRRFPHRGFRRTGPLLAWLIIGVSTAIAQSVCLPAPRLLTTMPMGGKAGSEVEVVITGESIEGATELLFSDPRITAKAKLDAEGKPVPLHYQVSIAADCPAGINDARVLTPLGLSASRIFSVGNLDETVQRESSPTVESAFPIAVNSICNAVMAARGVNHYRFEATQGQRVVIDCAAGGIDSKLNPVVIVANSLGQDLTVERRGDLLDFTAPSDGNYLIKVHDLTFKGGAGYFYRLAIRDVIDARLPPRMPSVETVDMFSWPPQGLAEEAPLAETWPEDRSAEVQSIELPCDIAGSFYPAADVDTYEFTAKQGDVWWLEVGSSRLGRPTDPSVLLQRVAKDKAADGAETLVDVAEFTDIPSPVKVSSNAYAYDGPPYNAGSSDVLGKIEIPEDGRYRLQISDLFGGTRNDHRNSYRLLIRKAQPDFAVVAWGLHAELRNGDRNALSKPIALRAGATLALEVVVFRRDGFDGDIDLAMENLPSGVTACGLKIPAGKSRGLLLITADNAASPGWSNASFQGRAMIDGQSVIRTGRIASMAWPVKDAWSEIPSPRLQLDVPVSVGNADLAPITIEPVKEMLWEATVGEKLTIPLLHLRRSEFSGTTMSVKTMGAGFEHNPPFDLPLTADSSEAVLDLAALKIPPGDYRIAFYGNAVTKYVPAVVLATGGKPSAPTDIVDIVVSKPIHIRVQPAVKP